ncbi:DUF1190 domain-containing protein [Thalassolituus sp. LLYu03]|uniref:DUF1190 domain-containing protein n=1 Tax=Thalassolituus sp. LLYu03 TaxID=3421656 RepID=UPI003D2E81D1
MSKRTKFISESFFERNAGIAWVAVGGAAMAWPFLFDGRRDVYVASSDTDCTLNSQLNAEQCELAYRKAMQAAKDTAPVFNTQADCEAEFPDAHCTTTQSTSYASSSGAYPGTSAYWGNQPLTRTTFSRSQPQMSGFMVDPNDKTGAQSFNPVFQHRNEKGQTSLVTASGEQLKSGSKGMMRVSANGLSRPQTGLRAPMSRGGFGRIMAIRASAGG